MTTTSEPTSYGPTVRLYNVGLDKYEIRVLDYARWRVLSTHTDLSEADTAARQARLKLLEGENVFND